MNIKKSFTINIHKTLFPGYIILVLSFFSGCGNQKKMTAQSRHHYDLCMLYLGEQTNTRNNISMAIQELEQAIALDCKPEYQALMATLLFQAGQEKKSRDLFEHLLKNTRLNPWFISEIKNNYACLLAQTGQGAQALSLWQDLCANPWYLTPEVCWVNRGKLYVQNNNYAQALTCFEQAISLAPDYVDAHFYLAITQKALNWPEKAQTSFAHVLHLAPDHQAARKFYTPANAIA